MSDPGLLEGRKGYEEHGKKVEWREQKAICYSSPLKTVLDKKDVNEQRIACPNKATEGKRE